MKQYFLDCNAHMPMCKEAIDAFIAVNNSLSGHGHAMSPNVPGRAAETMIEKSRQEIAELLGAEVPNQIFFTSTCTQACEWGLEIFKNIHKNKPFIYTSPVEHPAVQQALKEQKIMYLDTDENACIKNQDIPKDIGVCSVYVQNESGVVNPVFDLNTTSLFSDMSQAPGKIKFPKLKNITNLDVAVFASHKFCGPSSVGFVYIKDINAWKEFGTGSRYFLDRAGTPDLCSIVATAAALRYSINTFEERNNNMIAFRGILESGLEELGFKIIGKNCNRIPGTTFAKVPDTKFSHVILHQLGQHGVYTGLGSACGSTYTGASSLIKILNTCDSSHNYIRFSQYGEYADKEAYEILDILKKII